MGANDSKRELRRRLRASALPDTDDAAMRSARLFERIEHCEAFAKAHTVALFASLRDEPPTQEVIRRWAQCKRIVLPRVEGDDMEFYDYCAEEAMTRGAFGIEEPQRTAVCREDEIDLMIVPGMAFDACCRRLGRGKGYYDRYMSRPAFRAATIGVCLSERLVEAVPVEEHDRRTDAVATDKAFYGTTP